MAAPQRPADRLTPDECRQVRAALSDDSKVHLLAFIAGYRPDVFIEAMQEMHPDLLPERLRDPKETP